MAYDSNSLVPICGCRKGRKHVHFLRCSFKFSTTHLHFLLSIDVVPSLQGPAIHVLVQEGALRVGQHFVAGMVRGRVRALRRFEDDDDDNVDVENDRSEPHHLDLPDNDVENSAGQSNRRIDASITSQRGGSTGKKKAKGKKAKGAKSDNNGSSSSKGQHKREISVLHAGEAGLALVALESDPAGRKKKSRGEIAKWSPVGEPLWGVSLEQAQSIQVRLRKVLCN